MVTCRHVGMRSIDALERFEEAVKRYLMDKYGFPGTRMRTAGNGSSRPVAGVRGCEGLRGAGGPLPARASARATRALCARAGGFTAPACWLACGARVDARTRSAS